MRIAVTTMLALGLCLGGGTGLAQGMKKETKSKNPKARSEKKKEELKDSKAGEHKDSNAKTKTQNETVKK